MTLATPTRDRALLYTLLSRLVTYPVTSELLRLVSELETPDANGAEVAGELRRMQDAIRDLGGPDSASEALNVEATRLLEGPGQPLAPPFGSFYLSGGTLMGPEATAVRQTYLDVGLLPDPSVQLPPDHLSLELGFLAGLARRAADGSGADVTPVRDAWRRFIANHLGPWLPRWQADLGRAGAHPFYQGLAGFISGILEADLAWLDDLRGISDRAVSGSERGR